MTTEEETDIAALKVECELIIRESEEATAGDWVTGPLDRNFNAWIRNDELVIGRITFANDNEAQPNLAFIAHSRNLTPKLARMVLTSMQTPTACRAEDLGSREYCDCPICKGFQQIRNELAAANAALEAATKKCAEWEALDAAKIDGVDGWIDKCRVLTESLTACQRDKEAAEKETDTALTKLATAEEERDERPSKYVAEAKIELLEESLATAERQRDALKETLAFYANPENYFAIGFLADRPCGEFADDFEPMNDDMQSCGEDDPMRRDRPGKRARAALAQLEDKP